MTGPFGREGSPKLDHGRLGGIVTALFLRVVDDRTGHGCDEDDGAASSRSDHVSCAGLRDEERAREVDVDQAAELVCFVLFGFDVGAEMVSWVSVSLVMCDSLKKME